MDRKLLFLVNPISGTRTKEKLIAFITEKVTSAGLLFTIDYTNAKEESTKRKLEPIGLIFYAFSWHLIGWCYLRKDYRDFKLQRIKQVQVTEQSFQKKDHISISEFMKTLPVNY